MRNGLLQRSGKLLLAAILLASAWAFTSPGLPHYAAPLHTELMVTGTFGELRGNHFHGGIDFRGKTGAPVYSIGDGYVKRISIQPGGFGQAVYVAHPEGYTSVYGHLSALDDSLLAYVRATQYARESFAVDLDPLPGRFPVRRGQRIGAVGNRGFSFGSHLHLEIRDAASDDPLNPLAFGLAVADHRPPDPRDLRVYELDQSGNVLDQQTLDLRSAGRTLVPANGDTLYVATEWSGLGIKVYDQQDLLYNRNGIYGARLFQDSTLLYGWRMDRFAFAESRYLNAHVDYPDYRENRSWFHRLFALPGNALPMYEMNADRGRIRLAPGEHRDLTVSIFDFAGNERTVSLVLARRLGPATLVNQRYNYFLPQGEESRIESPGLRLHFPAAALYEDTYLNYHAAPDGSADVYSAVHQIHTLTTPLHQYFRLAIQPNDRLPQTLRDRAVVARCAADNPPVSYGGTWEDGYLQTDARDFGDFCILIDTVPPIEPRDFRSDMRGRSGFSFRIRDNFPTAGRAQGLRYRAEVDGQWVLLEYDLKENRLFHTFDGRISRGEHTLTLSVTDDRQNTARWQGTFRR
jgi:hypothetical protein